MIICDFHTHSTNSDGVFSASEVVKIAHERNVKYLSLTDHDTLNGIPEAKKMAEKLNVNFIPGIELSTNYKNQNIHLLGYFKDNTYENPELLNFLKDLKSKRLSRAQEIINRLEKYNNIKINLDDVLSFARVTIARPHIAKAIIKAGYPMDMNYIFKNILGDDCPAYVPSNKLSTEYGINLLKKYNALVFIAHPVLFKKISIEDTLDLNIDGIEAIYPLNDNKKEKKLLEFAYKHNLLVSCGSDSHGNEDTDSRHGKIGSMCLSKEYLERFLTALKN